MPLASKSRDNRTKVKKLLIVTMWPLSYKL
jgi:hypothetical protein